MDVMNATIETGAAAQARPPAEVYDEDFVPALFRQWGPVMAGAAGVWPGAAVLDVGCGTGVAALAAAEIAGPAGRVVGLDPNPDMLGVARGKPGSVEWREGTAENLPFADRSFDAVVSQFAAMFFADPVKGLAEMARVLRPGGRLAVAVCGALQRSPGYHDFARLLDRLFGRKIGDAFRAPFAMGNAADLKRIAAAAGLGDATVTEQTKQVRFASIADLVSTERACAWTLGGLLDAAQFETLLVEAHTALGRHTDTGGAVCFDMPALIVCATKPA